MIKPIIKIFIEQHPYLWKLAWQTLQSSNLFLPHDPTYKALPKLIEDGQSLILDIGANQGISALSFRKLCPTNPIISFEPNPALEVDLKLVTNRISNFKYHMSGLGDTEGDFILFVPKYKTIFLHTFSSLDYGSLEKAINDTYKSNIIKFIIIEPFECKILTLDSFGYLPSVIKVDAEGFEEKIFLGGVNTLNKCRPSIIFEAVHGSLNGILDNLKNLDYKIVSYIPEKDIFHYFSEQDQVPYISGSRNLIAVSEKTLSRLKLE